MNFFEDSRSEEELEESIKEMKGTEEVQESLRDSGLLRKGGEEPLENFEDPEY